MGTPPYASSSTYVFDLSSYNNVKAVVGGIKYMYSELSGTGGSTELSVNSCTYNPDTKKATLVIGGGRSSSIRTFSGSCYVDVIQ
jgi:hypothetical protein